MRKKIVFLSRYQNKVFRGAETFVLELSKRLQKGFQVEILADFSLKMLNKLKPDIIIPVNGGIQALLAKFYCLKTGTKMIISGQAGLGRPDRINLLLRPNVFVATTKRNALWAKKHNFGVPITTIYNGVDLQRFTSKGKKINLSLPKPMIICVAGPEAYKRVGLTIRAVSKLKKASLLLVGGSKEDELLGIKLLKGRFLKARYDYQVMPQVYKAGQAFTLASTYHESFGIAYLEALACGLPVVAPNDQLRREILGEWGILVKKISDPNAYAQELKHALKQSPIDASAHLKLFSWDVVADNYRKLCLKILSS